MLQESPAPLLDGYDLVMLDLDGVVYIGGHAVPEAPEHLNRAREAGVHLAFVTNNASRTPEMVADHLVELGVAAKPADVVTSAQAAAHVLADRLSPGARVFLLGGEGLVSALLEEGLEPVGSPDDDPVAVVTGYGPDVLWRDIMRGAVLIKRRAVLGGQQHRPDHPHRRTARRRATASWSGCCRTSPVSSRWWPASRSVRCSTRPYAAWGATDR